MYAVVGCSDCESFWVVEGRPETTSCPSCRTRHRFEQLAKFAETDTADAARQARTALLADRSEHAPDELDSFTALESQAERGGMSDDEYLERSGLDAETVREAGERATEGGEGSGNQSRIDVVRAALADLDRPTEEEVVTYARDRDVPMDFTERALEKLVRRGAASEHQGRYRSL
ncbi:DUF5817 domain-containing protein [Halococcus qingdaonensis]|uniref:DUF5817 domain-containing protein n=1 Tax=Halococcus qingdaonensis TaxID=224402 RepID=UPI00211612F7|nr:DUF5817 domain-containing protein [Halococcus qingdaonensis]